jgi:Ca2+-transporting ATPase
MAYSSTLVTYGSATGVVVATGDQTEIGRINELISAAEVLATPLTKKIEQFSKMLLWAILTIAFLTVALGFIRGDEILDIFMAAVALAVAAIPEGLPAAMTIMLAIGVSKMASRNAIIRKLPAVETLGSTSVICSDKTGTLTQNQMTVEKIFAGGSQFDLTGGGYAPEGGFLQNEKDIDPKTSDALMECLQAGLLCNDSRLVNKDQIWIIEGDPTEGGLITSAAKAGFDMVVINKSMPRIDTIPFESEYQYMATLHDVPESTSTVIYMKGSVEKVLMRCKDAFNDGQNNVALNTEEVHHQVNNMTSKGLRVLAFAKLEIPKTQTSISHEDVTSGMTFIGLQGMIDPLRPEVVESVRTCQMAGIRVKMITGDHVGTATAIANQLGLQTNGHEEVKALSGWELEKLSDNELIEQANETAVFARVAPEQKLRLVEALQAKNHVTAMTGDGVNDAPALRQANIGIAMGITGTEVAKEAADMVLTDDNFSTIEAAVEEGRGVYDNLVRFITWTLPTNLGEALVILVAIFAGLSLPITPIQILWINMTTAVLLGLMLAFEQKEPGIMTRSPRDSKENVLTPKLIFRIFLVGIMLPIGAFTLYNWELSQGASQDAARAVAVNVFVFGELFYLFNCRSLTFSMFRMGVFSNRLLLLGVAGMILAQLLITYVPFMNIAFGTAPLGLEQWSLIIAVSFIIYLIIELEKFIQRKVFS